MLTPGHYRLRAEQYKTLHDEVFAGLSPAERAEYEGKSERIHDTGKRNPKQTLPKPRLISATAVEKRIRRTAARFEKAADKAKTNV